MSNATQDHTLENNRQLQARRAVAGIALWPFPKLAFKRVGAGEPRFAQMLRSEGARRKFILRAALGSVLDEEVGTILGEYESPEALVADGWVLD